MKVICIDASDRPTNNKYAPMDWDIVEGVIYTVMEEFICPKGVPCYALVEDPHNEYWGYDQDRFVPLSNIDEREIAEQRKELVNQ